MVENRELTVRETANVIKEMEKALNLLSDESYGREARLAYESSRFKIHDMLKQQFCGHKVAHTPAENYREMSPARLLRFLFGVACSSLVKCWIWAPRRRDYLVFCHQRLRFREDKDWYEDVYTDDLVSEIGSGKCTIIESPYSWIHQKPRPHTVWHNELSNLIGFFVIPIVKLRLKNKRKNIKNMAHDMSYYLEKVLGKNFEREIYKKLDEKLTFVLKSKIQYKLLLKYLHPKKILVLVSYGKEGLMWAAKELRIPSIEIQHGVITEEHLGYSFKDTMIKYTFPDYFLLFGDYWKQTVNFPIEQEKLITFGYPYLERLIKKTKKSRKINQILFISQGTIGEKLSKFAVGFAKNQKEDVHIVYKLHPGEAARWKGIYPWLLEASKEKKIEVIDSHSPNLYSLFAESKWQVGVYSTALFEGLAYNCITFLVNLPGVEYFEPLIQKKYVSVVNTPSEINLKKEQTNVIDRDEIFYPDWKKQLSQLENL